MNLFSNKEKSILQAQRAINDIKLGSFVLVNKKYLIKELLWPFSFLKKQKNPLDQKDLSNLRHVQGKVVVLAQEGHKNYYHWITEILPKLALLKGTQYDWVYLPRLTQPFQRETLDRMGVDPRKIIEGDENTYIVADELIVPSFVSKSFYTPRWVIDFLQEKLAKPETTLPVFSKKVFISRQKANYRRALNENDVFFLFKPLGFERYNLEDLTFVQQVQLFRDAEIVVAFHGAGLTNIIFCKPNTQIIEIFQARNNNSFCYLSQTSGLRYDFLKTTPFKKEGLYMDTTVPPDLIEGYVKKKFGAQTSLITSLPSKEIKSYN